MRARIGFWVLASLWVCGQAEAADGIQWGSMEVQATIHHAGVVVSYTGDDNQNARAQLRYRIQGHSAWIQGHPLVRIAKRRFAGSLFGLQPDTAYTLEVTLQDPDGSAPAKTAVAKTRKDAPPASSGRHLYVDGKRGKKGAPGTQSQPFSTIQEGVDQLKAGDTLHVRPGVYRESVTVRRSGTAAAPITIMADGPGAILDGSDPDLQNKPPWKAEGDGVYSTPFAHQSIYLAAGDTRLYDYDSLADLRAENGKQKGKTGVLKGGFFVDAAAKTLYLRLPDRSDPSKQVIYAAILNVGLRLETVGYVVVRGFELRYFGGARFGDVGIDIRNSHHCWIQNNHIHHINSGITLRKTAAASHNVLEDNRLRDTSVWTWPWSSVKAKTAEASAISIAHGRGNIVRRNRTEGHFNGIYVGSFSSQNDETIARDTDVYDNQLSQHGDDGLEPEGACLNVRFVRNTIVDVFNGISLAPIQVGPLWALRTTLARFTSHALKLNNGSQGPMLLYHTTAFPKADQASAQAIAPSVPFRGLVSRNNIWASNRYVIEYTQRSLTGPVSLDYDLLWTSRRAGEPWFKWLNQRYADLAAFAKGTGFETHGLAQKPVFEDAAKGDFRPAAGSPMLDRGVVLPGINASFAGKAPDLGAWERGQHRPPPREVPSPREAPTHEAPSTEPPHASDLAQEPAPPDASPSELPSTTPDPRPHPDARPGTDATNPDKPGPTTETSATKGCQCQGSSSPPLWLFLLALCGGLLRKRRRPMP